MEKYAAEITRQDMGPITDEVSEKGPIGNKENNNQYSKIFLHPLAENYMEIS